MKRKISVNVQCVVEIPNKDIGYTSDPEFFFIILFIYITCVIQVDCSLIQNHLNAGDKNINIRAERSVEKKKITFFYVYVCDGNR